MKWWIEQGRVHAGERFVVAFYRTLRVPDDGRVYPLPAGLGTFPVHPVEVLANRAPQEWQDRGGVVIPMYQREALWLGFEGACWKPNAVKVGVGQINAVSGEPWDTALRALPQDYLVCPDQPWLDGINIGDGLVRQFVAMPLGWGYTIEGQLTGEEQFGGIQILVVEPKSGRFPDQPPPSTESAFEAFSPVSPLPSPSMGIAAGGTMRQKIYPDPYGIDIWDPASAETLVVHIANSAHFEALVGHAPPPTPIDAETYTRHGFPWFDTYDEQTHSLPSPDRLKGVSSVAGIDTSAASGSDEEPFDVPEEQIRRLRLGTQHGKSP